MMKRLAVLTLACLGLAACASSKQTAGTALGATSGLVVAGPIGAVAGGAIGAWVTAPSSGSCKVGRVRNTKSGIPRVDEC
jgi:osmotically inducible lipoprotein OsmB